MLIDARALPPGEMGADLRRRVCVIGSGAAGATVALELGRQGVGVVLVEAGGDRAERSLQDTLRGSLAEGTVHDELHLVRQKRLGGTTAQWGGRCLPLDAIDFKSRPHVPSSGWPLSRSDLLPYYRRAHEYLRLGPFEYEMEASQCSAEKFLVDPERSSSPLDDRRFWRWSPPVNFGSSYRAELAASQRVLVLHHANAIRLAVAADGRASGVVVATAPGRTHTIEADAYVVAAGGLESARLLLSSPVGSGTTPLGNAHDVLGRYYMTHPIAEAGELTLRDPRQAAANHFFTDSDGVYCRRFFSIRERTQAEHGLLNMAFALWYPDTRDPGHGDALLSSYALARALLARGKLDWKSRGVQARHAALERPGAHLRNVARDPAAVLRFASEWVPARYLRPRRLPAFTRTPKGGVLRLRFDAEQSPERHNRVVLGRDVDRFGTPRLQVQYAVSARDRLAMARSLRVVANAITAEGAGTYVPPVDDVLLDSRFADGTHQMGLARMADSPREGVVDRTCRVHGSSNVYLAGSATFPTAGMAGPTLTIVALGLRLADLLARTIARNG